MHDGSDSEDRVAQEGGHNPANRLKETFSLDLKCPLILDIHVMVN